MGQPVSFFEVVSERPERVQQFYADLFGWQIDTESVDGYALVDTGAGEAAIGGGISGSQEQGDTGVKIYVKVDNLHESLTRAKELGGTPLVPPVDLPGDFGRIAVVADPDGNPVGLWA